ncbi:MAG: hypothetical protein ABSE73_01970 [Planctomycetota bacterium]
MCDRSSPSCSGIFASFLSIVRLVVHSLQVLSPRGQPQRLCLHALPGQGARSRQHVPYCLSGYAGVYEIKVVPLLHVLRRVPDLQLDAIGVYQPPRP